MAFRINRLGDVRYRLAYTGDESEQSVIIYRKGHLGRCAIIPYSSSWKFDPKEEGRSYDGFTHHEAAEMTAEDICLALGLSPDRQTVNQMILFVQDRIPALHAMRPYVDPVEEAVRALVTVDGKTYEASGADTQRDNMGIKVAH